MRRDLNLLLLLSVWVTCCSAFLTLPNVRPGCSLRHDAQQQFPLWSAESPDSLDSNDNNERNQTEVVTREMFQRSLLEDPEVVVKRRKNGGGKKTSSPATSSYKVLDNRDSLPFRVEVPTPDPYTHPDVKRKKMNRVRRKPGTVEDGLVSKLYTNGSSSSDDDDSAKTLLGEYVLDKHTTTGDLLEIGDVQYKVVRHKCQYKYAGGKRFVMVRKILQVKEVGRLQQEEYLSRQWQQS